MRLLCVCVCVWASSRFSRIKKKIHQLIRAWSVPHFCRLAFSVLAWKVHTSGLPRTQLPSSSFVPNKSESATSRISSRLPKENDKSFFLFVRLHSVLKPQGSSTFRAQPENAQAGRCPCVYRHLTGTATPLLPSFHFLKKKIFLISSLTSNRFSSFVMTICWVYLTVNKCNSHNFGTWLNFCWWSCLHTT